jgi:drug/metabolite transporter (DMT)-like permease
MPAVFVLIWSTGFIVARLGMPYAPPFGFLAWRYALSAACLLFWVMLAGVRWPQGRQRWHLCVTGLLMHAGYLGGVWAAVKGGMGAGLSALIVGLQPVLTALWLAYWGDRVRPQQWLGLLMGLSGLTLVIWDRLSAGTVNGHNATWIVVALLSITAGTLYQKRFIQPCDVRSANAVQLLAALVVTLPLALAESESVIWNAHSVGAMAWSVLALTIGASSLLYMLIQRGAATSVASLMYLVPPSTAVLAWLLFDEPLGARVLLGVAITAWGVWWVVKRGAR